MPKLCAIIIDKTISKLLQNSLWKITIAIHNIFILNMPVENCLPVSLVNTPLTSFTSIISSNIKLCFMTFSYSRKLPSKFPFSEANPVNSFPKTSQQKNLLHVVWGGLWRSSLIPRDKLSNSFNSTAHSLHHAWRRTN